MKHKAKRYELKLSMLIIVKHPKNIRKPAIQCEVQFHKQRFGNGLMFNASDLR